MREIESPGEMIRGIGSPGEMIREIESPGDDLLSLKRLIVDTKMPVVQDRNVVGVARHVAWRKRDRE